MIGWSRSSSGRPPRKFLFEAGAEPRPSASPAAMGEVINGEYEKWRQIVQAAKIEKE